MKAPGSLALLLACSGLSVLASAQVGSVTRALRIGNFSGGMGEVPVYSYFGNAVAALGDVDGDGVGDLGVSGWDAVWVLFLNADGSVRSHVMHPGCGRRLVALGDLDGDGITELASIQYACSGITILFLGADGSLRSSTLVSYAGPGFVPPALSSDFQHDSATGIRVGGLAALGDLDGDGIRDLAVGAPGDPDGGPETGAVWILFLRSDGTVRASQKISRTLGGFTGTIGSGDAFGSSLTPLGDLDGDGTPELGAGSYGGPASARLWKLSLASNGTVLAQRAFGAGDYDLVNAGALPNALADDVFAPVGDLDGDGLTELAMSFALHDFPGGPVGEGGFALGFLRNDGSVRKRLLVSHQRSGLGDIRPTRFGESFARLGDLDGDGAPEIAVSAPGGNAARGSVWILSLDLDARRNGSGVNPQILTQASEPVLGGLWSPTLDCSGHGSGIATVWGFSGSTAGLFLPYGEVLVAGTQYFQLSSAHASTPVTFSIPVPPNVALLDLPVFVQGACTGGPAPRLGNALDVLIGRP